MILEDVFNGFLDLVMQHNEAVDTLNYIGGEYYEKRVQRFIGSIRGYALCIVNLGWDVDWDEDGGFITKIKVMNEDGEGFEKEVVLP